MAVRLRKRKVKNGISYYLDIHANNTRSYEFLGIIPNGDKERSDKLKVFKQIQIDREAQALNGEIWQKIQSAKLSKRPFIIHFQKSVEYLRYYDD